MADLRILLADDHASVRRGIRSLLESHRGWSVCSEVSNGRQAVEQARQLRPDIILLDISMPELDGLQATREIVRSDPNAQILILTIHDSKEVAQQAALAGAKGALSKLAAHETLVAAIESLVSQLIHLAGSVVGRARHIAAFFHSEAERYRALGPFVAEGLARGEKAIHIIDGSERQEHIRWMSQSGVDLVRAEAEGKALLIPWEDVFISDQRVDVGRMPEAIQNLLRDAASAGFPLTRLIGLERPSNGKLVESESRLNHLMHALDDIVICVYDLTHFDSGVIVDVIRSHPGVLIDSSLHENPFYLPPDELIRELTARKGV